MRVRGTALVDVWLVRLAPKPDHATSADRAAVAHAALRLLVAQRARVDVGAVDVAHDVSGRPIVVNSRLHVSLSRSDDLAACAVSNRRVGIDVERTDRVEADDGLAARICSPHERALLAQMTDDVDRRRALILLWARKEAVAKALGVGLKLPFDQLDVADDVPLIAGRRERSFWIRNIEGGPRNYALTVAGEGRFRATVRSRVLLNGVPVPGDSGRVDRAPPG
jgi:phosphopantetheinyl transferase